MNSKSIAPCGIICDLCSGFQRSKNRCVGCNNTGNKPSHCTTCSIKMCPEKNGDEKSRCNKCSRFPCIKIRKLEKRYVNKYGESPVENLRNISESGINALIKSESEKWRCIQCGNLLCVHRKACMVCGAENHHFPGDNK